MDSSEVAGWHETLDEIEQQIMPLAREHGYSRDALLLAFMVHRLTGWVEAAVAVWQEEDTDEGWQPDGE